MTVIGTQTAAGLLALTLAALVYFDLIEVWHVFVLAFLLGIVNAVDMPARQSFVVEMVGSDDVANAVALNSAVFNGARIIGPAIAGILIGVLARALLLPQRPELRRGRHQSAGHAGPRAAAGRSSGDAAEPVGNAREPGRRSPVRVAYPDRAAGDLGHRVRLDIRHELQRCPAVMAANVLKVGSSGYGLLFTAMGAEP